MTRAAACSVICITVIAASLAACARDVRAPNESANDDRALVGAWRGPVQFKTGAFAAVHDLEFLYAFNAGGTMTESSNYDGAPPVPPAYGAWRRVADHRYQARYEFYATTPPATFDEIAKGNGWSPGGRGVLLQEITLSPAGDSFESIVRLRMFDRDGNPAGDESVASARATRMGF